MSSDAEFKARSAAYHAGVNLRHISLINAVLSLVKFGGATCPPVLASLGYDIDSLDKEITTVSGKIKPDVIVRDANSQQPTIFFEAKGGNNISTSQARRYSEADPNAFSELCPGGEKDVAYATLSEYRDGIVASIANENYTFPVVTFDTSIVYLNNLFKDARINSTLSSGVNFDISTVYKAVKFDHQSSYADIGAELARKLVQMFTSYQVEIEIDNMIEQISPYAWGYLDEGGRAELRDRVKKVLKEIKRTEFGTYIDLRIDGNKVTVRQPRELGGIMLKSLNDKRMALIDHLKTKT